MTTPLDKLLNLADLIVQRHRYGEQFHTERMQGIPEAEVRAQEWHYTLQCKYKIHRLVLTLLGKHEPQDLNALLLEWPHEAETDPARLAYTRQAGQSDRQVVTSTGKYLKRHFPELKDHVLRDYMALFTPATYSILTTTPDIIYAVTKGPRSCMTTEYGSIPFREDDVEQMDHWREDPDCHEPDWEKHPYACYAPSYGWSLVIREVNGRIDGRALVLDHEGTKMFVRTFARPENPAGMAGADHALDTWLKSKGYVKAKGWPEGAKLAGLEHPNSFCCPLVPYLDGENTRVARHYSWLEIDECGEYECDNADGRPSEVNRYDALCEDCGDDICTADDDYSMVGPYEDRVVCGRCAENYTLVAGSPAGGRTIRYLVPNDDAAEVWDTDLCIDTHNLPDDVVYTEDSNWAMVNNCWEDKNGDWWTNDTPKVCYYGDYYNQDNCWQSDATGIWYPNEVDYLGGYFKYLQGELDRVSSDAEEGIEDFAFDREQAGCEISPREKKLPL